MRSLLVVVLLVDAVWAGTQVTLTMDLKDYGLDDPTDDSCPSSGTGWYIDRAYDAACFGRQVNCASGVYQGSFYTCDNNEVYIEDGDFMCYSPSSSSAQAVCQVTVICNQDSIGILVNNSAIWDQTTADLQVGSFNCPVSYDSSNLRYMETYSLTDSSWSDCGIDRSLMADPSGGDGYSIVYNFQVKRYTFRQSLVLNSTSEREEEAHGGVVVTREKCFMVDAYCYYNADGTVTSSFVPSSANTLTQSDTSTLEFDLVPVDCDDKTGGSIANQVVYVNEEVCFRADITTTWHDDIRMQIQRCWATNSNGDEYPLANRTVDTQWSTDSTWDWDCYQDTSDLYQEYFSFTAFRFQNETFAQMNNIDSYVQTIDITCEVVACEESDTSSDDCYTECATSRRKRRAAPQSILGKYTHDIVRTQTFVMPKRESYFNTDALNYNKTFSVLMFGTGCVLAVAVVGLLVTLHKMKNQVKYGLLHNQARNA